MPRLQRASLEKKRPRMSSYGVVTYEYLCKITLWGAPEECKTFLQAYEGVPFSIANALVKHTIIDNMHVRNAIFSTAFQAYFCDAILLVFNLSSRLSFHELDTHLSRIKCSHLQKKPIIVVGMRTNAKPTVRERVIQRWKEQSRYNFNIIEYIETHIQTREAVEIPFNLAARSFIYQTNMAGLPQLLQDAHRQALISALKKYINRIEQHSHERYRSINFAYGFYFFADSRAANRKANYHLAQSLLEDLTTTTYTIQAIFENIDAHREDIIESEGINKMPHFVNRGINSQELKTIIETATRFTSTPASIPNSVSETAKTV